MRLLEVTKRVVEPPYDIYVGYLDNAEFTVDGKRNVFEQWLHKVKIATTNDKLDDITFTRIDAVRGAIKMGLDPDKIQFTTTTVCAWVNKTGIAELVDKNGEKIKVVVTTREYETLGGIMAIDNQLEERLDLDERL